MLLNLRNFTFIIIVIFSCKRSDTPNPQNSSLKCQLVGYKEDDGRNSYESIYVYNDKSVLKEIKRISNSEVIDIEYNNDGQIKGVDWLGSGTPEFFYDSKGRLKKIVTASRSYSFFEYDSNGHLSQSTWFPNGDHGLETMYNPNFESFVSAVISKYNSTLDYSKQQSLVRGMGYTICTKYSVDEKNLTVTEIRNISTFRKFGDRVEELFTTTKYDGKNSPYNSADWRAISLYIIRGSLNDDRFPELGNVIEKTSKISGYSGDNSKRSYAYNGDGYPISGKYVDTSLSVDLTWTYKCN